MQDWLTLLESSPALSGFLREPGSKSLLLELAQRLRPSDLESGVLLADQPPALRFILSGRVRLTRQRRLLPNGSQHLGAGSVHGLQQLAEWLGQRTSRRSPAAATVEPTRFLELRREDLEQVPQPLIAWLLRVAQAGEVAEDIVLALSQEPRFANASEQVLFRLVESASLVDGEVRELLRRGSIPGDFFVLRSGGCRIVRSGECVAFLKAPACIGHKQFLLKRAMAGDAVLVKEQADPPIVIRIDGESFWRLFREDSDFQRALHRGSPELIPRAVPPAAHQILVLDSHEPFPLRRLGELLAERLAAHLQEHVLVLRVTKQAPAQKPQHFRRPPGAVNGWVTELARALPTPDSPEPLLPRPEHFAWMPLEGGLAGSTNVTLVDVSALEAGERHSVMSRLARELAQHPDEPLKLVYLSSTPQLYPSPDALPKGMRLVPTGVLSPTLPVSLQPALHRLRTREPAAQRLSALREALLGARDMVSAMGSHVRQLLRPAESQPTWPLGTVRVRLPSPWRQGELPASVSFPEEPALRETFDRWARAVSDRRVGLALGGGGAFGYVHLALLERLLEPSRAQLAPGTPEEEASLRVPVDMISGSSFGTVVGAFYCVGGKAGLELMKSHWELLAGAIPFGVVTSLGIQWILDAILGPVKLEQLEVPLFPVVVDADAGVEWDVRQGTVGYGVRASGAFPPVMGPLIFRNRRLLDGGFVANVPVNVLRTEGANLLIASNPIPRVSPRNRTYPRVPLLSTLWRQVNPKLRVQDSLRMLTLIGRVAGESQSLARDMVVYRPKFNSASIVGLHRGARVSEEAEESLELGQAVLGARALWRSRLNNPVSLVRWDRQSSMVELSEPVLFDGLQLSPVSQRTVLAELVDFLHHRKDISSFTLVATAQREAEAHARAQALRAFLLAACMPQLPDQIATRGEAVEETSGVGSRVRLEVKSGQLDARYAARMEEIWREQKEVSRRARADAQARRLHLAVERQAKTGDPDLVRLLALEAARLDRSADTDRALRGVLDRRGTLLRHFETGVPASCLAWSPDGQRLAVGYHNGTLRLWDVEQGQQRWEALAHPGGTDVSTSRVAWSPRGNVVASTGSDSVLALWGHAPEGLEPQGSLGVNTWNHCGLEFSPAGGHLLSPWSSVGAGQRGAAVFRVSRQGQLVTPSERDLLPGTFDATAWAPDLRNPRFATAGGGQVALWRVTKEGPEQLQEFPFEGASSLAWTRAGDALAVSGARGACILHPGEGAKPLLLDTQGQPVLQVAWSADGKRVLATVAGGSVLHVWDASGRLLTVIRVEREGLLQSVLGHPERPEVALTWGGEAACVWDISTGRQLAWLGGHTGWIHQAAWSADGNRVATASADGSVRVWEPFGGGPKRYTWSEFEEQRTQAGAGKRFQWPSDGVRFYLEAEAGKRVWVTSRSADHELLVQVRAPKKGRVAPKPWTPGKPLPPGTMLDGSNPEPLHWSPDGGRVVLREPERVAIWDAKTWKLRAEYAPEGLGATHAVWHPSSKRLAISRFSGWGAVMLWELEQSPEPIPLEGAEERDGVWDLAWSPDGEKLVTACNDSTVRIYSVPRKGAGATLVMSLSPWSVPRRVAWSPQGDLIACGDGSGAVEIWNTEGKDLVSSPQLRLQRIEHLVWSPDGSHLFSADLSGRALLWRRQGGSWVTAAVLDAEPARLRWAVFSGDGTWVATMDHEGKVRLHPVEHDTLVGCVAAHPGRKELTSRERAQYLE